MVVVNLNPKLRRRDLSDQVKVPDLFPAKPECLLAPELTIGPYCEYPEISCEVRDMLM